MRIHFIAIGGAAMHNLAIALHKKGHIVSGSDDEIYDPARSQLEKLGLLPEKFGWFKQKLSKQLDAVILGMHARPDNPELNEAKRLGLKIYSYPEFLYEQTKDKIRIVVAGSHGKTTTTSMVMHVLKDQGIDFDYMVGARIEGFESMVNLQENTKIAVFEGDEYLSSPIDLRPKFLHYKPHIALINGIAWDHINVFPLFEDYLYQFEKLVDVIEPNGKLFYYMDDKHLVQVVDKIKRNDISKSAYQAHPHKVVKNQTILLDKDKEIPVQFFGKHNMQNLSGAYEIVKAMGLSSEQFYSSISTFKGAARRLQILKQDENAVVFYDFAHSPSKLEASINAVKEQYPERKLIACMELHTYSSLSDDFLMEYEGTMAKADEAILFYDLAALAIKNKAELNEKSIFGAFKKENLELIKNKEELEKRLKEIQLNNTCLLLMTSGSFAKIELNKIVEHQFSRKK